MKPVKRARFFAAVLRSVAATLQAPAPSANAQRQIAGLLAEKAARNPAQRKMSSHLVHAAKILRGEPVHADYPVPPDARTAARVDAQNQVEVDIRADVTPELLAAIANLGGTVVNSYPQYRSLRAILPLLAVEQIAARGEVEQIRTAAQLHHGSAPARVLPDRASARRSIAAQLSRFFRRQPPAAPPSLSGIFRRLRSAFFV